MPRLEVNLTDVHEPQPVPPGRYQLTIAEATYREEKPDIRISIGIDEHMDSPNVSHFISLPKAEDDEGKAAFKARMLKRFLVAFNIPHDGDGFEVEDFPGATAELELRLSDPDENGNVYNRLVLPRLTDESGAAATEEEAPAPAAARRPAPAKPAATRGKPAPARRR
jgi:hypothetical protein